MRTKFRLICLILASVFAVSCEQNPIQPAQESKIVDAIYRSLDLTPEQFGENMVEQGLHEIPQYDFMADHYKTYAREAQRTPNNIAVYINFNNDTILEIEYERSLNKNSDPAAYYKQFSTMIADYGYTEWQGYYEYQKDGGDDHSTMEAKDIDDLFAKINNEDLRDIYTEQKFFEVFTYTHQDGSRWNGRIRMVGSTYFSGMHEGEGEYYKDIQFNFILKRIQ